MNVERLGYVVAAAFAVASASGDVASALSVRAAQAQVKTVGARRGGVWNLWSEGELGGYVRFFQAGTYAATVRASGSLAKGAWPIMALCVDGVVTAQVTVGSAELDEYGFQFRASAPVHKITVAFLNDLFQDGEDRNLYVQSITIRRPGGAQEPALATREEWEKVWVEKEEQMEREVLQKAAAAIEEYRKGQATVRVLDSDGRPVAGASVAVEQVRHEFPFGCNIYMFDRFPTATENEAYKRRFRELFNYATTGFYWRAYERERGKPDYAYTDTVVAWCAENHIRLKGHPLLWNCQWGEPLWAGGQPPPQVQKQRIFDILRRYSGKIEFWEVVNEPAHLPGLNIAEPYRWAREADPNAYLIVNDYSVLANGYPPLFELLQEAERSGVPFDGIGIQAHEPRGTRFPLHQVQRFLDRYSLLGKELHITEFTPTSGGQPILGSHRKGVWDEEAQAEYAEKFYRVCFAHPAIVAITWWDLCDRGSWLKGGGLLREDLSPKPAYVALKKLIHREWRTRIEGETDPEGTFSFRGFYGTYSARVQAAGKGAEASFDLEKGAHNLFSVRLK